MAFVADLILASTNDQADGLVAGSLLASRLGRYFADNPRLCPPAWSAGASVDDVADLYSYQIEPLELQDRAQPFINRALQARR